MTACSNGLKSISQRAIPLGNRIVKTFIRILDLIQKIKQPSEKECKSNCMITGKFSRTIGKLISKKTQVK